MEERNNDTKSLVVVEQLLRENQQFRDRIVQQEQEIRSLKKTVQQQQQVMLLEEESRNGRKPNEKQNATATKCSHDNNNNKKQSAAVTQVQQEQEQDQQQLSVKEIERYSRQLLLNDGFGVDGQVQLLSSSVLVIGAGGIGSTVLLYLAAAGVGRITVVDFDVVDRSNLHRQVIHNDANVGMNKATSACRALNDLNPTIEAVPVTQPLSYDNALELVSQHDVVVDASDNPMTRYLINDACVLAGRGKPLVSGSAIGTEGQLTVYDASDDGPCYRCLYPNQPTTMGGAAVSCSSSTSSCSDIGVLGPVPGLIGMLQSIEVLKVLTGIGSTMNDRLLMYDSLRCSFITVKKPPRSRKCAVCGDEPTILSMSDSRDVSRTCRGPSCAVTDGNNDTAATTVLPDDLNISCAAYKAIRDTGEPHVLLDVRVPRQYEMCSLDGSVNIPLANLTEELTRIELLSGGIKPVYCLCRRGIFSAEATRILDEVRESSHPNICSPRNIKGGLRAWSNEVDASFPKY